METWLNPIPIATVHKCYKSTEFFFVSLLNVVAHASRPVGLRNCQLINKSAREQDSTAEPLKVSQLNQSKATAFINFDICILLF